MPPRTAEVAAAFVERAPYEALEAYRRVLGALVVAGEPLTERTQCGVLAVLRRQPLASLHVDATLLAGRDLVDACRVTLGPLRMGELLAAALPHLRMEVTAPCIRLGLGASCSLQEILAVVRHSPVPVPDGWMDLGRGDFCAGVRSGARVLEIADGLLTEGAGSHGSTPSPLTVHQFDDYRSYFIAAAAACFAAFPKDVARTPEASAPAPRAGSADEPLASGCGAR